MLSQRNPMDYSVLLVERNGCAGGQGRNNLNTKIIYVRYSKRTDLSLPGHGSW